MLLRRLTAIGLAACALAGCGEEGTRVATSPGGCGAAADLRLVYTGAAGEEGGDLFGLTTDGEVRRLTDDGGSYQPSFSPDGSQIVFSSIGDSGVVSDSTGPSGLDLHVMAADGSGRHRLLDGDEDVEPTWSPDGSQIAFVRRVGTPDGRIMVVEPDDPASAEVLVEPEEGTFDRHPAWSPDGRSVAFVRTGPIIPRSPGEGPQHPRGRSRLMVVAADGSRTRTILDRSEPIGSPTWSPDGTKLAISLGDASAVSPSIVLVDAHDGSFEMVGGPGREPVWSASGRLYAYARPPAVRDFSGGWRVAELLPDGDGFSTGIAVSALDPVGFLYLTGLDVPRCDGPSTPPLTSTADLPDALTVTDPVSGDELQVLPRDQALVLFGDAVYQPPSSAEVEAKLVPYSNVGPNPDIDRYRSIQMVWVVTVRSDAPASERLIAVFDAVTGDYLWSGPAESDAWWAGLVDLAR